MDGQQTTMERPRQHSGRVTVYNLTGTEVGCIIDGRMYAVPAGEAGGGRGTLVVPEHIAQQMLELCRGRLTMSSGGYTEADAAAMREMGLGELQGFAERLMRGEAPPVAGFRERWRQVRKEAGNGTERPGQSGRPAAGQESGVRP